MPRTTHVGSHFTSHFTNHFTNHFRMITYHRARMKGKCASQNAHGQAEAHGNATKCTPVDEGSKHIRMLAQLVLEK